MKKKFFAVALVLAMVFCLCACGNKEKEEAPEEDKTEEVKEETEEAGHQAGDLVGKWKCVSLTMDEIGTVTSEESMEMLGFDMPAMVSFSAWESGYCTFTINDNDGEEEDVAQDTIPLQWTMDNDSYVLALVNPELEEELGTFSVKFDGDTLVLTNEVTTTESESGKEETSTGIYNFEYDKDPEISIYSFCPDFSEEDVMKMGSFMKGARAIVLEDKTYCLAANGYLATAKISKDGSDVELEDITDLWNKEVCYPMYFQYADGYVYAILSDGSSRGIIRINTEDDKVDMIYDQPADYLQVYDGKLYFTDADYHYYSMDLDGKNITPIIEDRAIYYPYQLGDGWMVFQDDADGETLHIRHIEAKIEKRITEIKAYEPVLIGNYLYFSTKMDDGYNHVARANIWSGETEISEYGTSGEHLFEKDAIIVEGSVYPLDQWNQDLDPDPDPDNCEEYYFYTDGNYRYYNRHFMSWYAPNTNFGGFSAQVWIDGNE